MNLKQIAQKIGGYIQSKTQDDEGWIRQNKFTPVKQIQSKVQQNIQTNPLDRMAFSAVKTVSQPVIKSLANIGALGSTGIGALQMARNKPESAQKFFDTALNARRFAGTEGSFDQGTKSGLNTLKSGGLAAIQTALTGKGLKYTTPANLGIGGFIGGFANKLSGGDFATGFGQGAGNTPQIMGFVGASNPLLNKIIPKTAGNVGGRVAGAGLNVLQGIGLDVARGTPTTLGSVALDVATGLAGGKGQFETPKIKIKGMTDQVFTQDKNIVNEARQILKFNTDTPDQLDKLRDTLKVLAKKYELTSQPNWNKYTLEKQYEILSNQMDEMAKNWANVSMGIKGQQPSISTPQNKLYSIAEEFDNPEDFIAHYRGSATQYNKYTPEIRKYGTTENSTRISDLGIDPNRKITIYRGIDDVENKVRNPKINDGDFITTDKDSAGSYTGGTIVSKEVRAKDLITDFPDEFDVKDPFYTGAEFIYSDSKNKLIKYTDNDLRNIFDQSKKLGLNKIKQNSAEASKSLAYKNQYGFFKMGDKLVNDIETKIKSSYPEDYFTGNNYNKLGELITKELDNIVSPVKPQMQQDFQLPEGVMGFAGQTKSQISPESEPSMSTLQNKPLEQINKIYSDLKAGKYTGNDFNLKQQELATLKNTYNIPLETTSTTNYSKYFQSNLSPESKGIIKLKDNDLVKTFDETIKIKPSEKVKVSSMSIEQPELKQRGFSASVQQAPNVSKKVKLKVNGAYESKPNDQLMGEAKALLTEGGQIDFKNTKDIDKKVAATMQEAINQQKAGNHKVAADLFNNLSEQGTELGRGVQAFSLLKNMSPEAIALSAAGKIKKYNQTAKVKIPELTGEQVKAISDKVAAADLLKGEEKNKALFEINKMINEFIPSSLSDKALTVWKAGLLTSFRTHIRNFVGNTVHGVAETIKDIPATIADIGLSAKTGKRTITPTIKGTNEAWSKDTVEQMRSILGSGYDPYKAIEKFDTKQITWGKNLVEKGLKLYTDTVFRLLGTADKPFYNAAMARSLYSQAGAEAINAGKRGDVKFIENLVKNPTEDMMKLAIGDANVATFKDKNKATEIASALKRAMATTKAGKVISEVTMPFTGVPGSVLGQIISYSPAGLIKGSIDAGKVSLGNMPELQRQAAQEIGRGVVGTGIFALGSYLMSKGLMTGQPKDQEEQRQWELENKPRNSIMIGGKWRSLNSVGPEAVVFLAGAKLNEELNSGEGNLGTYGVKLGKDYLDQSFVQGLQGPVNAITDPNRYAKSYIGNQLSSVVPNIVKDVSKATDPYQREADTITDYAKQGIPGARQTLTEKRDVLGNIMPQEPTGGAAFIDIFNSKTPISNNIVNELSRLYESGSGATPSKLSSSQTILKQKVKLTAEQLNQLEAGVGEELRPKLETLISSPVYTKLSDENKAKAIDKLVQDTRDKYKTKNSNQFGVSSNVKVTPIEKPKYTGNATADKKLKTQYENAVEKQQTDLLTDKTESPESDVREYIDEDGNYKTVDLSPIEYPEMTGNTVVDKKLKSSYYSSINAQINDVIKLYKAGEIDQEELTKLVTTLDTQYNKGKSKKAKKIAFKVSSPKALPKITLKISSPVSRVKLKSAPKIKLSKTDNRKYTIKA